MLVNRLSADSLTCVTTNSSETSDDGHTINITFDTTTVQGPDSVVYSYLPNPSIKGIDHKESIVR